MKRTIAALSALASAAFIAAPSAQASAEVTQQLDVWHTTHADDPIKKNSLNPNPVCNAWSQHRTHITSATTSFVPMGAIQLTNDSDTPVQLKQTLSSTQSLTLKVDGDFGHAFTTGLNGSGSGSGLTGGGTFTANWTQSIKPGLSYTASWSVGQEIGPYTVKPGYVGRASYGFTVVSFKGTQQYCKLDGTWSKPTPLSGIAPIAKDVRIEQYAIGALPNAH